MDFLIVALASAFVVSTVDYFKYLGFYRVPVALVTAGLCLLGMGFHPPALVIPAAAAAFLALTTISVVDRIMTTTVRGIR